MTTITITALIKRINRKLVREEQTLRVTRSCWSSNLGAFHVENHSRHLQYVLWNIAELEEFGRDRGCLGTGEEVRL
jgi:hypothetical protein